MKSSEFMTKGAYDNMSTAEKLQYYAETGLERLRAIEEFTDKVNKFDMHDEVKARLHGNDPTWNSLADMALQPGLCETTAAFAIQLKLTGFTLPDELMQADPVGNRHACQNVVQQVHQMATWAKYGMNVFNLTHGLTAGLLLTEPPPLTEETFQIPFPAFGVVLPEGFVPFWWRNHEQKWASMLWVHRFNTLERGITYQVTVECQGLSLFRREGLDRFAAVDTIETELRSWDDDPPLTKEDDITMSTAVRIARNLAMWINANGYQGGAPHVKKKAKRKPDPKDHRTPVTWFLGREVKLSPELRKMAAEVALGQSKSTAVEGWRVRMRHVVRGHWKQQAHGEGRTQRKRLWVEPYWRGPEGAAAWSHLYQPKDE